MCLRHKRKVKNAVKFSNLVRPAVDQFPLTASSQAHTSHTTKRAVDKLSASS
jgi:hypothetical protein